MYHTAKRMRKRRRRRIFLLLPLLVGIIVALHGVCIITDGTQIRTHYAFFSQQETVLADAGIHLDPLDTIQAERHAGIRFLTVLRAPRVKILYHGQEISAAVSGETVAQLLHRLDLTPEQGDVVSLPGTTPLADRMEFRVDLVERKTEICTSVLPFRTEYQDDPAANWGKETALTAGADGEMLVTSEVTYINGQETDRTVLHQEVLREPETRIVSIGTSQEEIPQKPEIHYNYLTLPEGGVLPYYKTAIVEATAYTGTDAGCSAITATGTTAHKGTVCVDPAFIPYGTRMYIMTSDGCFQYGIAQAEDCRPGIDGWRIDLYMDSAVECTEFGRQKCTVFFLGNGPSSF